MSSPIESRPDGALRHDESRSAVRAVERETRSHALVPIRAVFLATLLSLAGAGIADAAPVPTDDQISDAEERVDELEGEVRDETAREEVLASWLAELDARLGVASEQLAAAEARAAAAEDAAEAATAEVVRTETELAAALDELEDNRQRLDAAARDAWVHGGTATSPAIAAMSSITEAADLRETADAVHLLGVVVETRSVLLQDTESLVARTEQLQRTVRAAQSDAADRAGEAESARETAASQHARVLSLVAEADESLRRQRDQVSESEAAREAAGRELRGLQRAREDAQAAAAAAITSVPVAEGLTRVGGITVAASLAPSLERLLEDAYADGILLTGYGYRSPETTARLRLVNGCPDVYESPASACRVPTARPGESMHERGLAVDFNHEGATLCYPRRAAACVGNPAFDWLTANAARYGLQVLDSEAWHWSTNGE